jgi:hypothetical protein
MQLITRFAQDEAGNLIPEPAAYVYLRGTNTLVTGLVDKDDAPLTNPFDGTVLGLVQFKVANGDYDLRLNGAGRDYRVPFQALDVIDQVNAAEAQVDLAEAQVALAANQVTLAAGHVATSQSNALAAAASAASIQDTAARVGAMLKTRGITNIRAIAFKSAEGWEKTGRQSYKTETRPAGRFLGDYANATDAWAANYQGVATVAGDYYWQSSGTIGLFECTTSNASAQRYRAGSDHMPLEACFVASGSGTSLRLRVFDLTDPLMSMWMEFIAGVDFLLTNTSNPASAVLSSMVWMPGKLVLGHSGQGAGLYEYDFRRDAAFFRTNALYRIFQGGLTTRTSTNLLKTISSAAGFLMNNAAVQSNATHNGHIAAATQAGMSVIKPDATVVKSSSTANFKSASIVNGRLYGLTAATPNQIFDFGPIESLGASFAAVNTWTNATVPALSAATLNTLGTAENRLIVPNASAVDTLWPNTAVLADSLIARKGTTFATPPMKKPEVMLICSTVEGTLAGTELITNGGFDVDANWTKGAGWTIASGVASITSSAGTSLLRQSLLQFTYGTFVRVSFDYTLSGGSALVYTGTNQTATATISAGSGTYSAILPSRTGDFAISVDAGRTMTVDNISVKLAMAEQDHSGKSNHATINGNLTATAEVAGGVAGLSGFTVANYLEATDPWDGIGTGEGWIALAFKSASSSDGINLLHINHWNGSAYEDAFVSLYMDTGFLFFRASASGGSPDVRAITLSAYRDGLINTVVCRKTATHYELSVNGSRWFSVAVGAHGNLVFNASAVMRVGVTGNLSSAADNTTIWFAGAGKTALSDEEAELMHTHMRNLILNKANLDEIPSVLAYSPVTKAVEMVGATYRQTMIDGAITSSVAHGQGTTPAVGTGSRGEIAIGGTTGVSVSVPERKLREYEVRLTKERFTVLYAGNASRTLFPLPTTAAEMAVTLDARPVRVSNAGVVQTEGAAEDYVVRDYGLGRYVVAFAVAPGNGNDVLVEFEREVYR